MSGAATSPSYLKSFAFGSESSLPSLTSAGAAVDGSSEGLQLSARQSATKATAFNL